jgi:phosphoglycolate phosphatase
MFKEKKLIIFDMDGTLIDSVPSLSYAINYMLKAVGKDTLPEHIVRDFVGNGADVLIKRALLAKKEYKQSELQQSYFNEAKGIFLDFYGKNLNAKTTLYPNVTYTLEVLKNSNYTLALATNKPIEFVPNMLKHFNIDNFFKIALGGGSTKHKKPHPQILQTICKELNIKLQDAVMVGDSSSDILAAKRANIDSIALTYGYNQGINLKELEPTVVCSSFREILQYFK